MNKNPDWNNVVLWYNALNRGQKANLRHCSTIEEIYLQPAYIDLVRKLGVKGKSTLPIIAGALAHAKIQEMNEYSIAKQMAKIKIGHQSSVISPIRFRNLLACKNENRLLRHLIRIVKQIDTFDIAAFAKDMYWWNDHCKKNWAFTYYENLPQNLISGDKTT